MNVSRCTDLDGTYVTRNNNLPTFLFSFSLLQYYSFLEKVSQVVPNYKIEEQ